MQVLAGVCCFLLLLLTLCAHSKKGKKLEETSSFDVKPSGQISHHTIKLVSQGEGLS